MRIRKYGVPPYQIAVLHGGPGGPGYMGPVARELAKTAGVLESLQSEDALEGQIEELRGQLIEYGNMPMTLVASSWGAVLALFLATRKEVALERLILVGSAVFDAESSSKIGPLVLSRLSEENRQRYQKILDALKDAPEDEQNILFKDFLDTIFDAYVYDPITRDLEVLDYRYDQYKKVWPEFVALRDRPGFLKKEFSKIDVPVVVIQGEYDPHPANGVQPFLESCLSNVRFHALDKCGHYPWIERQARERFFEILHEEISS